MKQLKPILILAIYLLIGMALFSCQHMTAPIHHEPPAWDEPKPYIDINGSIDTIYPDLNQVVRAGCDQSNGWAACQLNTVNDLHPSTVFKNPADDSVYILTYCDKPSDHFKGELHAVWNYSTGAYEERCNGVIYDFPNGMDDHYLNCWFQGFPGFSCP